MHLLGLHGKLHSGKDSTYELMKQEGERVGLRVERIAFADYLKVSGALALGGLGEDPSDLSPEGRTRLIEAANDFKEQGAICVISHRKDGSTFGAHIDGRKFWQIYGTEAHREALEAPDFWIETLLKGRSFERLENDYEGVDILVVTDVRFDNEAKALRNLDQDKVTIARVRRGPDKEVTHISEAGVSHDLIDYEIDNSGDLEDLSDQVSILLSVLLLKESDDV